MSRPFRPGRWIALAGALLAILFPVLMEARPGGGESYSGGGGSYSGGGGSSSGGGSDGDGGLIFLLIRLWFQLVFRYPVVGVPLTIVIVLWLIRQRKRAAAGPRTWDSAPPPRPVAPADLASHDLETLRAVDPDFSPVLFEDFAFSLFARAHQARWQPAALEALAPYLSEPARRHLAGRRLAAEPVTAVVIGALRVTGVRPADATVQSEVTLEIDANLTSGTRAQYVRERWKLVRKVGVRSKPPEAATSFHCPNCGAPFTGQAGGGRCEFCGEVVTDGRFDWSVQSIDLLRAVAKPPALTSTVEEVGTSWPTVFHPELAARRAALLQDDPATTDAALRARLVLIYGQLNAAWTGLDLASVRPYVSDSLFDYLQYWIDAYRQQGLRNVLEGMHVVDVVLAKVGRDRYYDALTFRIWGSGRDYTVRQSTGDVLSGDPQADRAYSEYWTLVRGAGVRGAPGADASCPNCGAPLQVNRAGICAHCSSKITRGDFDWVLSKIEQDDAYSG